MRCMYKASIAVEKRSNVDKKLLVLLEITFITPAYFQCIASREKYVQSALFIMQTQLLGN